MGNEGSALMYPGQACVACHTRNPRDAPRFVVAGTAYFLDHESNDCNGYGGAAPGGPSGAAYVELVDATGRTVRVAINAAGNFSSRSTLSFPLRTARVIGPTGSVNEMGGAVPHGDCNGCHTQDGATTVAGGDLAPGRITVPF